MWLNYSILQLVFVGSLIVIHVSSSQTAISCQNVTDETLIPFSSVSPFWKVWKSRHREGSLCSKWAPART